MPGGWGDVGRGAATGASVGSFIPGIGTGIGAGIGALGGWLFGHKNKNPKDDENPEDAVTKQFQESSGNLRHQAGEFGNLSAEAITPVLQYLKGILGPNASVIMDATRGARGRVMDQYDTARQAIAEFGPRGGGTTSALASSRFAEGESLADLTSNARNEALSLSGQIGTAFAGLGLSAEQLASADLNSVLNAILTREGFDITKRGQNMEALGGLGEALGTIIAAKVGGGG